MRQCDPDGAVTRCLAQHPDFFDRLRALVGVPLRVIHVVRNPFDNIAAISLWHELSLDQAIAFYFEQVRTTARLESLCWPGGSLTVRHETFVRAPAAELARLCAFVGLEVDDAYLADCAGIVFRTPTRTRRKVEWSAAQRRSVEEKARPVPFLRDYDFAEDGAPVSP